MDSLHVLAGIFTGVVAWFVVRAIIHKGKDLPVLRPEFVDDPVIDLPSVSYTLKLTHLGDKPNAPLVRAIRERTQATPQNILMGALCVRSTGQPYTVLDDVSIADLRSFLDTVSLDYTFGEQIDFSLQVVSYSVDGDKRIGNYESIGDWKGEMVAHA